MGFQWHFPMEFHFCDFWCVIFCPEILTPDSDHKNSLQDISSQWLGGPGALLLIGNAVTAGCFIGPVQLPYSALSANSVR